MNVSERINRVLFILSYVTQNQGVHLDELARHAGIPAEELTKELDFILLIGKPPFQPDDYIDIYLEDDRVYVEYDQMLNRPLRFTRPEAMALLMSLQLLDPGVDPKAVGSLEKKIQQVISQSVEPSGPQQDRIAFEQPSIPVTEQFQLLRQGIENNRKIRIKYYSLTSDRTTSRKVRPYLLTRSLGYWYLSGYCELRRDIRTFKFERILSVSLLKEEFPPPRDLDVERYKEDFFKLFGKTEVEIHFAEEVAPWIREQWSAAVRDDPDGGVILTLNSETLEFPTRLILSYAPHARPLQPPELIENVRRECAQLLEMYEPRPVG